MDEKTDQGTVSNHIWSDDWSLSLSKGSQPSHELQIQRCFPLAQMNPGLWSLVALAPASYEVWKGVRTPGAVQLCKLHMLPNPVWITHLRIFTQSLICPFVHLSFSLIFQWGFHLPSRMLNSLCSVVVCVRECIFLPPDLSHPINQFHSNTRPPSWIFSLTKNYHLRCVMFPVLSASLIY